MKKKLLSILLVLSLMLALVPAAFAADTGTLEGGLTWELDSTGLLTISGEGAIPDNNAGLCRWADMNVTAIEISDGVTAVGAHAFEGCDQAGYVYLPSTVEKLGDGALSGMDTLQAIYVDETNPAFAERDGALYTKDGKTLVQVPAAVTEFVVPDGVTAIGSYAFSGCAYLRGVYFPASGLTAIGYNAFSGCTQLKDVILPDGLTRIDMNVFNRCSALTEVTIPASVTEVRGFSFMGCTALTDVYYTGTQAQWDAVRIDTSYGDPFKNAAVHVDAEQHVFGAWQTVEQPGCEQPGTISRTCTNGCGLKQTAAAPALGHDWDEGVVTTEPDGVLCGILHVTCKRCGAESDELLMPEIWAYEQFGDVDPTLWSYEGIQFCVMMGYMSGMDTHVFAPRGVTTRAQLVQILYNFVGGPEVSGETPFTDLTANWYKDAVLWAYQTGVTSGTSETTFAPDDPVTREQVAVLLYEFADKVLEVGGAETPADLSRFPDGDQVSSWAREAMADAVALGIINGTKVDDQVFLAPQGSATRDQIATMFEGFCASLA